MQIMILPGYVISGKQNGFAKLSTGCFIKLSWYFARYYRGINHDPPAHDPEIDASCVSNLELFEFEVIVHPLHRDFRFEIMLNTVVNSGK